MKVRKEQDFAKMFGHSFDGGLHHCAEVKRTGEQGLFSTECEKLPGQAAGPVCGLFAPLQWLSNARR